MNDEIQNVRITNNFVYSIDLISGMSYLNAFLYFNNYSLNNRNIRYLDWNVIQPLLDGYRIKITDPNGIYEDYYSPTIRELIESNEEYSALTVREKGDNVRFEFILKKK